MDDLEKLASAVLNDERRALARAITLVESTRPDHRERAETLLNHVMPKRKPSLRIGISGAPGVGKSTFIEAFGLYLIEQGERVAVLAIDPSSRRTGGSILGDKTRMETLSRKPEAFIRPSPSGGSLGGVARRTREAMALVEAAGFSVVIVETVGVGQSETAVADMVDLFLLLLSPAGGDDLQGIKRGIMELADLAVINKADGDFETAARHAASDVLNALHLLRPRLPEWRAEVLKVSALENRGMEEVWDAIGRYRLALTESGTFRRQRAEQAVRWMWAEVEASLLADLTRRDDVAGLAKDLEAEVARGDLAATVAARRLLAKVMDGSS